MLILNSLIKNIKDTKKLHPPTFKIMTCDTFVICQAHGINQVLQPVTGVIISSSAGFNYFKRHFQDTKDVKCLNHNDMETKSFTVQCP